MIVDDDPILLEVGYAALRALGISSIFRASSGTEALQTLQPSEHQIDLIISDLQMPSMDGLTFFRALKAQDYCGALIVLSSMDDGTLSLAQNLAASQGLDVRGALPKPLNVKSLAALLKTSKNTNQKFGASVGSGSTSVEVDIQDLRDAISNGDIHPYFQGKICLATGAVIGAEVLARWFRPESGLVPPDQFITLAEQHGLIADLTWRLLRTALAETRRIREDSPDFRIAVNLSADLLYDLELPDRIATILSECDLDADALALELTETTLLKPSSEALEVVGRLRLMGIELSIDDFGTGQANLSTLSCYPFSELKIDQSFIKSALTSAKS